jgi:hypothetical protein
MPNSLKTRLAAALKIKPAAILNYVPSPKGGGYTVILTNYQKHNNIEPIDEPASPEPAVQVKEEPTNTAEPNLQSAIEIPHSALLGSEAAALPHASTSDIPHPTSDIEIPDTLNLAYLKPHRANREALRQLCDHLSIPYPTKTRKTQLVSKINDWKKGQTKK